MHRQQRKICKSGIAEDAAPSHTGSSRSLLPTTLDLKKARRLALKSKPPSTCIRCKRIKSKSAGIKACECPNIQEVNDQVQDTLISLQIERPIHFGVSSLQILSPSPWPEMHSRHEWSSHTIRGFWSSGYKISSLQHLFSSIPPPMSAAMEAMFLSLERLRTQFGCAEGCDFQNHSNISAIYF